MHQRRKDHAMKHPRDLITSALARLADALDPPKAAPASVARKRAPAAPVAAPDPVAAPEPARDTPRHAPADFPFPVWSDADVERYRAARAKGCSDVTGHRLVKNRKPAWTRKTEAYGFNHWGEATPRRSKA